jgi:cobalt transporter subunit CbtA
MVFSAVLAGLLAASALTLTQALWVTPLILQAEVYEDAADAIAPAPAEHHDDGAEAWQPENGWPRLLATSAGNGILGIGYGLILTGLYAWRRPSGAAQGLAWGLAGYAVFFAAPGLGLPPELPGSAAAELGARQSWWLATAASTSVGLGLMFLQTRWPLRVAGGLLLIAPHMIGAPQPAAASSLAPEDLQTQFRLATLLCNALFWSLLGVFSAAAFRRFHRVE